MMRWRCRSYRRILVVTLGVAILTASRAGIADDTDLFTTQVAPNVMLIVDNSGSMNQISWHTAYRPDAVYDPVNCLYIADPNDPAYDPTCLEYPLCSISSGDSDFTVGTGNSWSGGINLADFLARMDDMEAGAHGPAGH